eukprot:GHVS01057051.1.p1 GENE.GHVS01057051.1~~GHVS01057051.1.p1  ORF type:complete len:421 (-),score=73.86 GHVS01057051.1:1756-2946(-)
MDAVHCFSQLIAYLCNHRLEGPLRCRLRSLVVYHYRLHLLHPVASLFSIIGAIHGLRSMGVAHLRSELLPVLQPLLQALCSTSLRSVQVWRDKLVAKRRRYLQHSRRGSCAGEAKGSSADGRSNRGGEEAEEEEERALKLRIMLQGELHRLLLAALLDMLMEDSAALCSVQRQLYPAPSRSPLPLDGVASSPNLLLSLRTTPSAPDPCLPPGTSGDSLLMRALAQLNDALGEPLLPLLTAAVDRVRSMRERERRMATWEEERRRREGRGQGGGDDGVGLSRGTDNQEGHRKSMVIGIMASEEKQKIALDVEEEDRRRRRKYTKVAVEHAEKMGTLSHRHQQDKGDEFDSDEMFMVEDGPAVACESTSGPNTSQTEIRADSSVNGSPWNTWLLPSVL